MPAWSATASAFGPAANGEVGSPSVINRGLVTAATQSYRNAQNSRTKIRRGFRWVSFNLKFSFCCQGRKSRLALLTGLRGVAMMGYIK